MYYVLKGSYLYVNDGRTLASDAKMPNEPLMIKQFSFDRFPYTCIGWNTDPNANEAEYLPYDYYTKDESSVLYAIWQDAYDLGEITGTETWEMQRPYDYCTMWFSFTVSESAWYCFETKSEFVHFSWTSTMVGIYSENNRSIGSTTSKTMI